MTARYAAVRDATLKLRTSLGKEPITPPFKVGDRVQCITNEEAQGLTVGEEYTVYEAFPEEGWIMLEYGDDGFTIPFNEWRFIHAN